MANRAFGGANRAFGGANRAFGGTRNKKIFYHFRRPKRIHYMGRHRNSQKRIYIPGATYFITTVTCGRYPYFEEEIFRDLFVHELMYCSELKSFSLYGYAVMPDHAHVLFRPMGGWNYSEIMFSLKKQFSHMANCVMGFNTLYDVTISWDDRASGAAPPEGAQTFERLRGALRGYRAMFMQQYGSKSPHPPFKWQKSYHDHYIRDMDDLRNHLAYIARQCSHHGCGGSVRVDGMGGES